MRCLRCGHRPDQHTTTGCNIKILTHWDNARQAFTGERSCSCTRFIDPPNANKSDCPHEKVKDNPCCVHCGAVVTENA